MKVLSSGTPDGGKGPNTTLPFSYVVETLDEVHDTRTQRSTIRLRVGLSRSSKGLSLLDVTPYPYPSLRVLRESSLFILTPPTLCMSPRIRS